MRPALFVLVGLALGLGGTAALAQQRPCDSELAGAATEAGWERWRAGNISAADSLFRRAVRLCPAARGAWTGLGYVALRRDQLSLAIARFDSAFAVGAARDADALIGLGLATFRAGDRDRARRAFVLADSLAPGDATVREHLARLPAPVDARALPPFTRPAVTAVAARAGNRVLEVPDGGGGFRPLWVKAVNLGAALPGKHPSEFPPDDGTYDDWIRTMAEMGANAVRVYTIHPPHFYRALRDWNLAHPSSPLWIIHGVWTELPPGRHESDYDDAAWNSAFLAEMRRVVDLTHGQAAIAARPGHASGLYAHSVAEWTLGYILGREWEPYSVQAFVAKHPRRTSFSGRYVRVSGGNAVDVWLAGVADSMVAYEMARFNAQRPIAYTNWPTLDPLSHPTESSRAEEAAWNARRGERVPEASREYDNDAVALDATKMTPTADFPAGLFASFHAYPYYPEFLVVDPEYARAVGREGPSAYLGYLRALVAHHGSLPVLISEYGVPSSRGNAHLQPQGWHHGGHDERAQAEINARLTREIAESGAAGVGIFALIDEWFKKNWLVIDFEQPAERNRLWLNVLDPEQNYGVIAMRPGLKDSAIVIDGDRSDWQGRRAWYTRDPAAAPIDDALRVDSLFVHADEAYVYLRLDVGRIAWDRARYLIGIDTYDARLGDHELPYGGGASSVGLEFVVDLDRPDAARVLVDSPYNLYRYPAIRGARPAATQAVYNRPFRTLANRDGRYDTLWVTPNRRTIARDGRVFEAQRIERNKLRHARQSETTLADWFADTTTGVIELRIPWGMLHVMDPSSRHVLFGTAGARDPAGRTTDGFRFVVRSLARDGGSGAVLPSGSPPTWSWATWEIPRWHAERKPLFDAMRDVFRAIP
jgi:tetratricopeptide (TPR) repeat protein